MVDNLELYLGLVLEKMYNGVASQGSWVFSLFGGGLG